MLHKPTAAFAHFRLGIIGIIFGVASATHTWGVEDSSYLRSLFHRIPYNNTAGLSAEADVSGSHSSVQQPLAGNGGVIVIDTDFSAVPSSAKPPKEMGDSASQTIQLKGPASYRFGHIDLSTIAVSGKVHIYCDSVSGAKIVGDFTEGDVSVEMTMGMKRRQPPVRDKGRPDHVVIDLQPSADSPHRHGGKFHLHVPNSLPDSEGGGRLATSLRLTLRAEGGRLDLGAFGSNYSALRQAFESGALAPGSGGSIAVAAPQVGVGTCLARAGVVNCSYLETNEAKIGGVADFKINGGNGGTISIKTHLFSARHETLSANGTDSGAGRGGTGGQIFLETGAFFPDFKVLADGGSGGPGQSGGNGGVFMMKAGGFIETKFTSSPRITLSGGYGGSAELSTHEGHGGSGGNGGYCRIERLENSMVNAALNDPTIDLKDQFRPIESARFYINADGGEGRSGYSGGSPARNPGGNGGHGGPGGVVDIPGVAVNEHSELDGGRGGTGGSGGKSPTGNVAGGRGGDGGGAGLVNGQKFGTSGRGGNGGYGGRDIPPGDGGDAGGSDAEPGLGGEAANSSGRYRGKTGGVGGRQPQAPEVEPKFPSMGVSADLAVDYNRDGEVSFGPEDRTTKEKPLIFWINSDSDVRRKDIHASPFTGDVSTNTSDWDIPVERSQTDADDTVISSPRDLEDFTRLWVEGEAGKAEDGVLIQYRLNLEALDGSPAINVFLSEDVDGGMGFLTDEEGGERQVTGSAGQEYSRFSSGGNSKLLPVKKNGKQARWCLIFEGARPGFAALTVETLKNGKSAAKSDPLYLRLLHVENMYETWTVGDLGTPGVIETKYPNERAVPLHKMSPEAEKAVASPDYFLFVHGWNMDNQSKNVFANTAFKRLWHQGYKGKFGAFCWPTFYQRDDWSEYAWAAELDFWNYDTSERNAWLSGKLLAALIRKLHLTHSQDTEMRLHIYAHSMGNVVVGESLRQLGPHSRDVRTYIAAQAAISAHAWDSSVGTRFEFFSPQGEGDVPPNILGHYWEKNAQSPPHEWANKGHFSYFHKIYMPQNKITRYVNHCNTQDYALDFWRTNQYFRPAVGYRYQRVGIVGFYGDGNRLLKLDEDSDDRYLIFAFASESHSKALGQELAVRGAFQHVVNLNEEPFGFKNTRPEHSAQFNYTIQKRWEYWKRVMNDMWLDPLKP